MKWPLPSNFVHRINNNKIKGKNDCPKFISINLLWIEKKRINEWTFGAFLLNWENTYKSTHFMGLSMNAFLIRLSKIVCRNNNSHVFFSSGNTMFWGQSQYEPLKSNELSEELIEIMHIFNGWWHIFFFVEISGGKRPAASFLVH